MSAIAFYQAHEQNNAIIKGVGVAVGLLSKDMDSALRRWEVAGPEVSRLLEEYERLYNITSNINKRKHHEDYTEFQKTFFNDTQKLFFCFNEIRNPFEENRLVVLDTGDVMNCDVETCLANLLERNEERYKEFYKHRLVICNIPITNTIKTYKLDLPGNVTTKSGKAQLQATQLKSEEKFAKAAAFSITYREEQVKRVFSNEVTNFPSISMCHSSKSGLLKRWKQILEVILEPPLEEKKAMVVDLLVAVNGLSNTKSIKPKTFGEFYEYVFVELNNLSRRSARINIVCDLYPGGLNLKESIQIKRGIGVQLNFDNDTEFPSDFASNFLRKNESKRVFSPCLVDKILEKAYYKGKIVVVARNEKIEMNLKVTLANINMSESSHSAADPRIILHVFSCVQDGLKDIYVRTNDTDVVVILIAYMPDFLEIDSDV